ncbi:MAG: TIM-barrel domain-containing protein [Bacteroidota bacterium]
MNHTSRKLLLSFLTTFFISFLQGQIVRLNPPKPTADDTVSIIFDASQGNRALKGHLGPVYMHTGAIIGTPEEASGWRYIQGEWGTDDPRMRMKKIGTDLYQIKFHVRSFYGIPTSEPLLQLSFVFRNQNGSIVAKQIGESDIYYPPLEFLEHGPIEKANAANARFMSRLESIKSFDDGSILLGAGEQALLLRSFGERSLQLVYYPLGFTKIPDSEAIVASAEVFSHAFDLYGNNPIRIPLSSQYELYIEREPFYLAIRKAGELLWEFEKGFFFDNSDPQLGTITGIRAQLTPAEQIFGAGSRALPINRRGQRLYAYNTASYAYTLGEDDLNISIPFILSDKGYGLFFDSYRRAYFDIGQGDTEVLEFGAKDSLLSTFVIFDERPAYLLAEYTRLTGRQPLPPRWALGYIQSRLGYRTQSEAESIIQKTKAAGFPIDATLMDLYWFGGKERMGDLEWDRTAFPDPEGMITKFDKQGIKTLLTTEPYFVEGTDHFASLSEKGLFAKDENGLSLKIPDFWAGPAALLDLTQAEAKDWLWPYYQRQIDLGVAGWGTDSAEPENHPLKMRHELGKAEEIHNVYGSYWAKILFEQHQFYNADQRFFNLTGSGYAGMQRYATFPWSGDVSRTWDAFRAQPMIMLGAGLNGLAYMHADLGGFTGGPTDPELFRRWLQMGAFVPIMRVHGDANNFDPEPIFYDDFTQQVVKRFIKLRYQLMPYNYTLAYQNHTQGAPLARPFWFHFPQDSTAASIDNAYLWGEDILVYPIFEQGATSVERYLPAGQWYDFWNDELWQGGSFKEFSVSQESMPLFVKAGAFIPMHAKAVENSTQISGNTFEIHYYLSERNSIGQLFWDDGISTETLRSKRFQLLQFTAAPSRKKLFITASNSQRTYYNKLKKLMITIHGLDSPPSKVKLNGKKIPLVAVNSWDEDRKIFRIPVAFKGEIVEIEIKR